ncbi:MAG: transaldolase [Chlorobi bacterium CHB2]|nr:transaldolase [Chlorobi bacterium CHB2]
MNPLQQLLEQGQSIWYDFISRQFIANGTMQQLVDQGVRGMTSNPTIFEKAIAGGSDYDEQIQQLSTAGNTTGEIALQLFITDVRRACDVMRPIYDASNGADGFISLEVSPTLANDTEGTIAEAERIWRELDRPNVMIKIPATPEGIPAVRRCIAAGININITLMFSLEQYRAVAEAYIGGLEDRLAAGGTIAGIASVASVFVSRIDSLIDGLLGKIGTPEATALQGKAAIANTKLTYQIFKTMFSGERWERLAQHGAQLQRPLWASTSVKNPAYPDLLYVDTLIGPWTVNTVPPETLVAIMDHATVQPTIETGIEEAEATLRQLTEVGLDMPSVMDQLLNEGVEKFTASFGSLFAKIEAKR